MSMKENDIGFLLAKRLRTERERRGWSLGVLAAHSGVSKTMIAKIERGEASPTAMLLGRLSGAFELTLSTLLALAEGGASRLMKASDQPTWIDPHSGYVRRQIAPRCEIPLDLVEVNLPAGAEVLFPASSYTFIRQMIWVLEGHLTFHEGDLRREMEAGDCLALGPPADCVFHNTGSAPCRYLVIVLRQS
jgi:transcriptional regulator with XRE-family HTH domain